MTIRAALMFSLFAVLCLGQAQNKDLERYSDIAREALGQKKWTEAAEALEHLSQIAPNVPEVHANLGLAYFFEGRPSRALSSFARARTLSPALPQIGVMIGLCKAELGENKAAIDILSPAFQHSPDADTGRLIGLHLQKSYSDLKQFDKALTTGEELMRRYPNDPEILYQLSRLHAQRSSDLMATLLRVSPDSSWIHYANAQVQESLDRFDTASQEYRLALVKNPALVGAHYRLGHMILQVSRTAASLEQAKHEFEQELAISPRNADAEYQLGQIESETGDVAAAADHFARALLYHPEFVEACVAMAKALLRLGRTADALPYLQEAARLDPKNRIPHYLLASAYKSLGDPNGAARELQIYKNLEAPDSAASSRSDERQPN